jgi:very-short-patch-repair endonuclease
MLRGMAELGSLLPAGWAEVIPPALERQIAMLAQRQHGVVTRRQLRALGLSDSAVGRRLAAGSLHGLHRGVYAVGHPVLGIRGRYMAAVLACGPAAALSHASAGALWDLRASAASKVDVSVPRTGRRARRSTIRVHRPRALHRTEVTVHHGIPVTTPARTILDLAATLDRRPLERLLDRAETLRLTDVVALGAIARAHPRHRGAQKLRAALEDHTPGTTITKSELEERFLRLCRDHGLPRPRVNTWVEGFEVDFLFAARRVIVETDSWQYHRTREQFDRDRRRDAIHARAGYRTLRFTHTQLTTDARTVAEVLRVALARLLPSSPP